MRDLDLKRVLNCLKSGDTLVAWKLDRLRELVLKYLIGLISDLEDKGIHFTV
ncbi:MAG: recombinase family protein [Arsenophonus sp. NC-PE1-MAG3]